MRSLRSRTAAILAGGALAVGTVALVTGDELPWTAAETPEAAEDGLTVAAEAAGPGLAIASAARAEGGDGDTADGEVELEQEGPEIDVEAEGDVTDASLSWQNVAAVAEFLRIMSEENPDVPGLAEAAENVAAAAEIVQANVEIAIENAQAAQENAGAEDAPEELPDESGAAGAPEWVPGPPEGQPERP